MGDSKGKPTYSVSLLCKHALTLPLQIKGEMYQTVCNKINTILFINQTP